jgi:hypothetical protein
MSISISWRKDTWGKISIPTAEPGEARVIYKIRPDKVSTHN